jgi:hypothetical protein
MTLFSVENTKTRNVCVRREAKRHRRDAPQYACPGDGSAGLSCSDGRAWARVQNHLITLLASEINSKDNSVELEGREFIRAVIVLMTSGSVNTK